MTRRLRTVYCPFPYHLQLHGQHLSSLTWDKVLKEILGKEKDDVVQQRALKKKVQKGDLLEQSQRL